MELSSTSDIAVSIKPLETSQDWVQWANGIEMKLQYHNLYKYIQARVIAPVENEKEPSSYLRRKKFEADQARTTAISKSICSEAVRSKIRDFEAPGDRSPFAVYEYLKNEYSKQNAHSLGTLFKKIAKAKLTDCPSIKDYGNAIIDADKSRPTM